MYIKIYLIAYIIMKTKNSQEFDEHINKNVCIELWELYTKWDELKMESDT